MKQITKYDLYTANDPKRCVTRLFQRGQGYGKSTGCRVFFYKKAGCGKKCGKSQEFKNINTIVFYSN